MYTDFAFLLQSQVSSNTGMNWSSNFRLLGQFFFLVIVFCVVLFLAVFATKLVGGAKFSRNKNSNLLLIESMSIGYQNLIHLIKIGDRFFLIGSSKERICYLTEIDTKNVNINTPDDKNDFAFELNKLLGIKRKEKN